MYSKLIPIRPRTLYPAGDSFADPFGWTDVCTSGTGPISITLDFDENTYSVAPKYYAVSLSASTEYTFKGVNTESGQPNARIDLYDAAGTKVAYNAGAWNGDYTVYTVSDLVYTPTESGEYVFNLQSGDEMGSSSYLTYGVYVSPRTATLSKVGPTPWETSAGFGDFGRLNLQRSAKNAGLTAFELWYWIKFFDFDWERFMEWLRGFFYHLWLEYNGMIVMAPLHEDLDKDLLGNSIDYAPTIAEWETPLDGVGGSIYGSGKDTYIQKLKSLVNKDWELSFDFFLHWDLSSGHPRDDYYAPILGAYSGSPFAFGAGVINGVSYVPNFSYFGSPAIVATSWGNNEWRRVKFTKTGSTISIQILSASGSLIYSGSNAYDNATMDGKLNILLFNNYQSAYSSRVANVSMYLRPMFEPS